MSIIDVHVVRYQDRDVEVDLPLEVGPYKNGRHGADLPLKTERDVLEIPLVTELPIMQLRDVERYHDQLDVTILIKAQVNPVTSSVTKVNVTSQLVVRGRSV